MFVGHVEDGVTGQEIALPACSRARSNGPVEKGRDDGSPRGPEDNVLFVGASRAAPVPPVGLQLIGVDPS